MKKSIKYFSSILAFSILLSSCSDDDSPAAKPKNTEAKSAYMLGYRVETPEGRVYYMEAHEDIPSESNVSEAVELGLNRRIFSYGEHPYIWNGDDATMTKWTLDKTTLELSTDGVVSFSSTGISGFVAPPIFLSETQAFFSKLAEGVIVEWNPTTMEIIKTHNVDPLPDVGVQIDWYKDWYKYSFSGGKILMTIELGTPSNCCSDYIKPGAMVAIFDPVTGSIEYVKDERLYSNGLDMVSDKSGSWYLTPGRRNAFVLPYFNVDSKETPNPFTVLKLNPDGKFDPDFYIDLSEALPVKFYASTTFMQDNKLVFTYVDANDYEHSESYSDRWAMYSQDIDFKTVVLDLETLKVTDYTGFDLPYDYTQYHNTIEGKKYFSAGYADATEDVEYSYYIRQDAFDKFEVVFSHKGGTTQNISKLW